MSTDAPLFSRNVPGTAERLARATVAIAGCGGLGSNAAVALARSGLGRLILVDFDRVEFSNLNRQHYFQADLGLLKVDALARHLLAIHPGLALALHALELTPQNLPRLLAGADLLIEAFDSARAKRWLIEAWIRAFPGRPIVCASGLSGYGRTDALRVRSSGPIHLCGDEGPDSDQGLMAPRVALVAAMQANVALELLLGKEPPCSP